MRRDSVFSRRRRELDVKMTPMIDVVFLLLVFFVWTASFQIVEHILPSSLSAAVGTEPSDVDEPPPPEMDFEDVVIRIYWDGSRPMWSVNEAPVESLAAVRQSLQAIGAIKPDAPIILHPDGGVPLGHVIDVYDVARIIGFDKVQFAASTSL